MYGTLAKRLHAKVVHRLGNKCWPFLGELTPQGKGRIWVNKQHGKVSVHKAVQMLKGPIPKGMYPLACPILKDCCNPDHIRLGTKDELMDLIIYRRKQERYRPKKRTPLSDEDVITIFLSDEPTGLLAKRYERSPSLITNIRQGRKYIQVTKGYCNANQIVWPRQGDRRLHQRDYP